LSVVIVAGNARAERSMRTIEWARLRANELRRCADEDAIVVIPIGATEQHGPHLPVMVDYRLAHEVAIRAARLAVDHEPIVVTPVIPFGMSEHHISLGGTLTFDFATMQAVVRCVCESAIRQGFRRLFILNGHGGNIAALETIVTELTVVHRLPIACSTYWQIASEEISALLDRQAGVLHACEAETSMVMAIEGPDVDEDVLPQCQGELIPGASAISGVNPGVYRWRQLGTRSLNGVIGDASTANANKGERLLNAIADRVAQTLRSPELWSAPI
jgi:creatinine amidohydrolase